MLLMAHQIIAIDGTGADGSAEGAGGVEPGPSNDHGWLWSLHRSSGRSDGPSSSPERPRQRCGSPPCSERAPASQAPQVLALGVETFHGVRQGGASHHRRLHIGYVPGTYAHRFLTSV